MKKMQFHIKNLKKTNNFLYKIKNCDIYKSINFILFLQFLKSGETK